MSSKAATVEEYLASLPADRRSAIEALRKVIKQNLDKGFEEGMQYGMIGYYVPHSLFPAGYHCDPKEPLPFASIASQKASISVHLFCLYIRPGDVERFVAAWKATGKKLDMGKACVRFKRLEDAALEPIGAAIKAISLKGFIESYVALRDGAGTASARKAQAKVSTTKPTGGATKARPAAGKAKPITPKAPAAQRAVTKKAEKKPAAKKAATKEKSPAKQPASKQPAARKKKTRAR